jgi:hypothetical protein
LQEAPLLGFFFFVRRIPVAITDFVQYSQQDMSLGIVSPIGTLKKANDNWQFCLPKGFFIRFRLGSGHEKNFHDRIGRITAVSRRGTCLCMGILDDRRVRIPLEIFCSHGKL